MTAPSIHQRQCHEIHQILWRGFARFNEAFARITLRAGTRFEQRDWPGMHRDTVERLDLYPESVSTTMAALISNLGSSVYQHDFWSAVKEQFSYTCRQRCDAEIAGTFYNSVYRKLFAADGVDPEQTFLTPPPGQRPEADPIHLYEADHRTLPQMLRTIMQQYAFETPFADLEEDARLCAFRIDEPQWTGQKK